MKVIELLEYKNKYYKPVPRKIKVRAKKSLWYNNYDNWVADVKSRFPDSHAFYDEENEEIVAACDGCKECYGRWSKKKKGYQGVSFEKPRNLQSVYRNANKLKKVEDDKKPKKS